MLRPVGFIDLPEHVRTGGFDHAAVHTRLSRLYVAHTANDTLELIDCAAGRHLQSIPGLQGVAGALVSEQRNLVFTSNRGENSLGIFSPGSEGQLAKIPVGVRPNGLAFDPRRGLLLAANVGDPAIPDSYTLSVVDIAKRQMIHSIPVPGRTRWTVFDEHTNAFYINISDPAQIVVVKAAQPDRVAWAFDIPAAGPHGLDLDPANRRLFCACDAGVLLTVAIPSGEILGEAELSGAPDVIFFNPELDHLYVAIGDPGVIDVFDTTNIQRISITPTARGAHTIAFDAARNRVYAFLPQTHQAAVFVDEGDAAGPSPNDRDGLSWHSVAL